MDSQQIENLLERYWACETSPEEEKWLKSYFSEKDIPENLSGYAPFFILQQQKKDITAGEKLSGFMENLPIAKEKKSSPLVKYFYPGLRIAASVMILVMIGLGIQTHHKNRDILQQVYSETYTDPEMALEEVHHALDKIGTSLMRAQSVLEELTDSIETNIE